jgi:methionyl-tRNA formyltransferase
MDAKIDHGPIISQFKEEVFPSDTTETLRARLFERSAVVLVELLQPYLRGKITPKIQDESEATYTKIMTRENGYIDLNKKSAEEAEKFIRAMQSWPVAWTRIRLSPTDPAIQKIKIHKAHIDEGKLVLDEVQLEGKDKVSWKQFKEGYKEAAFVTEG